MTNDTPAMIDVCPDSCPTTAASRAAATYAKGGLAPRFSWPQAPKRIPVAFHAVTGIRGSQTTPPYAPKEMQMMVSLAQRHEVERSQAFKSATDPAAMAEVMHDVLMLPDQRALWRVADCQIGFARRSDGRSLYHYDVILRHTQTGVEQTAQVTGVAYNDRRGRNAWTQVHDLAQENHDAASPLYPAAYVPEMDMLLQVFPFDHRLPALRDLLSQPTAALTPLLMQQFGGGAWQMAGWQAEVMRYRVAMRACLQLTVSARKRGVGQLAARRFFAKVYASDVEAERAGAIQHDLTAAFRAQGAPLALPEIVAYLPAERTLVHAEALGSSLFALQRGGDAQAARSGAERAAQALAAFHQLDLAAPAHRLKTPRAGAPRVQRAAHRLRVAHPELATEVDALEFTTLVQMAALPDIPEVGVHGDFKPPHLLLGREHATLLDLDKFAAGEPMLDVISMVRRLGPRHQLGSLFARAYFRHAPAWQARFAPHYAAVLLEEAAGLERAVRARPHTAPQRRDERVGQTLARARQVLFAPDLLAEPLGF